MSDKYLLFTNIRSYIDEQYAIYNAANKCGYKIIMLAPNIPEHLKSITAVYQFNDNKDENGSVKKAIELAQKYDIYGVFSWTDVDVVLSSKIAKAINVPSVDPDAAYLARNKYEMRKAIYNHNRTLVPDFIEVTSIEDIKNNINQIGFPAVLKPISASGSKGIFVVHNLDEALNAFESLRSLLNDSQEGWFYNRYGNRFILESFIVGQEFSVEGLVVKKSLLLAGITDKLTTNQWHLEYRHIFPANYSDDICMAIAKATTEIVFALGLDNCPIHLEGKWTDNGFKLIEIAARIGGDLIHTHLIENSLGLDWLAFVINAITKQEVPETNSIPQKTSGIQFILAQNSKKFHGFSLKGNNTNPTPGIKKIEEIVVRGKQIVMPPQDFFMQRLGYILAEGNNFEAVENLLTSTVDNIEI